ncbi:hypothetical protein [Microviridae Fen7918_21]|uniref:hypothetical protein n=1 Tax=Microviridae Fen7918_21 TaxID=1655661 RepID=UPI00063D607D|nr:hypothetical protein [Microviridae Fen7918_21]AKI26949.1 hypothetical protein [Microviridae Fen7918_21]
MTYNVISPQNFSSSCIRGESNTKPSLTQPDQTFTIREILEKYAQGEPLDAIGRTGTFLEDDEPDDFYPDPQYMDLVDRAELAENAKHWLKEQNAKNILKKPRRRPSKQNRILWIPKQT